MPSAADLKPDFRFVGMFVGPKHSGKTVAACSFLSKKNTRKAKVLDFDGRIRGILDAPWIDRSRIDYQYYPPRVGRNEDPTYVKINNDMEFLLSSTKDGTNPYDTLILDSLTAECFAMVCDAVSLTHAARQGGKVAGKQIGQLNMAGPEDYGFEATGTYNLIAFLRSLNIPNIIVTAHVVDKFGKRDPEDKYSESVVVGEKLSVRDKIGANTMIYFDHIFRFDREMAGNREKFTVQFRGDLACTSYPNLGPGTFDITGKSFYDFMMEKIQNGQSK